MLTEGRLAGHDVVVISPQYWGDYWVSKHWIAYELSKTNRVLFVEPPVWLGGVFRNPRTGGQHLHRLLRPLRNVKDGLFVYSPILRRRMICRKDWSPAISVQAIASKLQFERPVVLNFDVDYALVRALRPALSVYYCVDPVFPSHGHEMDEAITCAEADLVYAVSDAYAKRLGALDRSKSIHVVPHGYSFELAREVAEDPAKVIPPELARLPRPILGFVGSIHDSYVDVELVEALAAAWPQASIVLIGPYKNNPIGPSLTQGALRRLRKLRNVHLLGPRPFLDVPRFVKFFDVGLVLINVRQFDAAWKVGDRTLFKWLMYLSQGKPVVAPGMFEAKAIQDIVYLAGSTGDYVSLVGSALAEDAMLSAKRIAYARQFGFGRVLARLREPIENWLLGRRVRGTTGIET